MRNIEWYSDLTMGKARGRIGQEKKGEGQDGTGDRMGTFGKRGLEGDENREGITVEKA